MEPDIFKCDRLIICELLVSMPKVILCNPKVILKPMSS